MRSWFCCMRCRIWTSLRRSGGNADWLTHTRDNVDTSATNCRAPQHMRTSYYNIQDPCQLPGCKQENGVMKQNGIMKLVDETRIPGGLSDGCWSRCILAIPHST